jgi:hypothetical protein
MFETITEENFLLFAMHSYDNTQCATLDEFEEDLKRFMYLKKLFSRYKENGDLRERLIINHIIVLHNLFGIATTEMLFHKIDKEYWSYLVTFLVYLERMPEEVPQFGIKLYEIPLDENIIAVLRKI